MQLLSKLAARKHSLLPRPPAAVVRSSTLAFSCAEMTSCCFCLPACLPACLQNVLPLARASLRRVHLVGPWADNAVYQLGSYYVSYPLSALFAYQLVLSSASRVRWEGQAALTVWAAAGVGQQEFATLTVQLLCLLRRLCGLLLAQTHDGHPCVPSSHPSKRSPSLPGPTQQTTRRRGRPCRRLCRERRSPTAPQLPLDIPLQMWPLMCSSARWDALPVCSAASCTLFLVLVHLLLFPPAPLPWLVQLTQMHSTLARTAGRHVHSVPGLPHASLSQPQRQRPALGEQPLSCCIDWYVHCRALLAPLAGSARCLLWPGRWRCCTRSLLAPAVHSACWLL